MLTMALYMDLLNITWPAGLSNYTYIELATYLTYLLYAIAPVLIIIYLVSSFGPGWHRVAVPIYGHNSFDIESPKKRWMTDSISLMQEGYNKVRHHFFLSILDMTLIQSM